MNLFRSLAQRHVKPENCFLFFAITFGLLFVFLNGPFQAPDEFVHYFRAYRMSTGSFLTESNHEGWPTFTVLDYDRYQFSTGPNRFDARGFPLPKNLTITGKLGLGLRGAPDNKLTLQNWLAHFDPKDQNNDKVFFESNSFVPFIYLPQSLGVAVGRWFRLSPLACLYLGRICNLIIWTALVWGAIRTTPIFKSVFAVLALLPMSLFLAASLSYDAFTNAISFYFIALILRLAYEKNAQLNGQSWLHLTSVALATSISKYIYSTLCFSFLLIPAKKCRSGKAYYLSFLTFLAANMAGAALWFKIAEAARFFGKSAAYSAQITHANMRPFHFFGALYQTLTDAESLQTIRHFFGVLGWLDTPLPFPLQAYCALILIVTAVLDHRQDVQIPLRDKAIIGLTTIPAILLIYYGQYLTWTPPESPMILGVQGRYFIPLAPLLFLLLYSVKFRPNDWTVYQMKVLPTFWTISLSWTAIILLQRYFDLKL